MQRSLLIVVLAGGQASRKWVPGMRFVTAALAVLLVAVFVRANQAADELTRLREQNRAIEKQVEALKQINEATSHEAEALQARLEQLASQLAVTQKAGEKPAGPKTPSKLRGTVLEADADKQLVTITLGADAGLTEGATLAVYRASPQPKSLGRLRILRVLAKQALATFDADIPGASPLAGDAVVSEKTDG